MKKSIVMLFTVLLYKSIHSSLSPFIDNLDYHTKVGIYIVQSELEKNHQRCIDSRKHLFDQQSLIIQKKESNYSKKIELLRQNKYRKSKALKEIESLGEYEQYIRSKHENRWLVLPAAEEKLVAYTCMNISDPLEVLLSIISIVDHVELHPLSCKKMFESCFETFVKYDLVDSSSKIPLCKLMCAIAVGLARQFREHKEHEPFNMLLKRQHVHSIVDYKNFLRRNPYCDSKDDMSGDVDVFDSIIILDGEYGQIHNKNPLRLPLNVQREIEDMVVPLHNYQEYIKALQELKKIGYIHSDIVDHMIQNIFANISPMTSQDDLLGVDIVVSPISQDE